jgi:hypothetical protein
MCVYWSCICLNLTKNYHLKLLWWKIYIFSISSCKTYIGIFILFICLNFDEFINWILMANVCLDSTLVIDFLIFKLIFHRDIVVELLWRPTERHFSYCVFHSKVIMAGHNFPLWDDHPINRAANLILAVWLLSKAPEKWPAFSGKGAGAEKWPRLLHSLACVPHITRALCQHDHTPQRVEIFMHAPIDTHMHTRARPGLFGQHKSQA